MAQTDNSVLYVVVGIPINNAETAKLVRKVMTVAVAMTALLLLQNLIVALAAESRAELFNVIVSTCVALLIPACGCFGAKQRDRNLLCCFCGCSAFNAVFVIYMLIGYFTFAGTEAHQDSYGVSALTVILLICSAVLYTAGYALGYQLYNDESLYVELPHYASRDVPVATVATASQPCYPAAQPANNKHDQHPPPTAATQKQ